MTEVDYGGGGHRTRLGEIFVINLCVFGVPPTPVYKGVEEGEGRPSLWRALGGVLLPLGVGFPPFQVVGVGVKERGKRREGRRGRSPSP